MKGADSGQLRGPGHLHISCPGFTEKKTQQAISDMSRITAPREARQSDNKQQLQKGRRVVTKAVLDSYTRLRCKLSSSSRDRSRGG
jgi:hypothetical protein